MSEPEAFCIFLSLSKILKLSTVSQARSETPVRKIPLNLPPVLEVYPGAKGTVMSFESCRAAGAGLVINWATWSAEDWVGGREAPGGTEVIRVLRTASNAGGWMIIWLKKEVRGPIAGTSSTQCGKCTCCFGYFAPFADETFRNAWMNR